MTHTFRYLCVVALLALSGLTVAAQVFTTATPTGAPPFSSSTTAGPDTIDLANSNVHLDVPVLNKSGRGMNFNYNLSYDSTVWVPITSGSSVVWKPISGWGWRGITEATTGFMSANVTVLIDCTIIKNGQPLVVGHEYQYDHWAYHDPDGTVHSIATGTSTRYVNSINCPDSNTSFANTPTNDGSGHLIKATGNVGTLTTPGGAVFVPPTNAGFGVGTVTDSNGNQISADASGNYFDTLTNPPSNPTLTIAGSGTAGSPFTFSYPAPATSTSGVKAAYSMKFTAFTVQTNFGCGSPMDYPATANNLVTEIDLPDIASNPNSKYIFAYETTPGDTHSPHFVTGRIASVTLPTGGTITYAYSGGNNGINCSDGSTATLTRTLNPGGTWTYAQAKGTGAASTTTITDPASPSNVITIQFQGIYETERVVNQGASTALKTLTTCYNSNPSTCTIGSSNGTAIALPIVRRTIIDQFGSNGPQCKHDYFYDSTNGNSFGLLKEQDDFDYGSGAPGALLRKQLITYASPGNGIVSLPGTVTLQDGGGNTQAQTTYCYDEATPSGTPTCGLAGSPTTTSGTPQHVPVSGGRGNVTTIASLVSSGITLGQKFTYFDTGNVNVATDINGAQTTYTYGACGNSFPTSIAEPLSLSRQMTWNCTGGVQLTDVDENSKTTTTAYTDAYFWRPASSTDRSTAVTSFCYGVLTSGSCVRNSTQTEATLTFNAGASTSDVLSTVDGLGRPILNQRRQSPTSTNFDTNEQIYNNVGLPSRTMLPYVGTAGQANTTGNNVTTTYDALGRPLSVQDSATGSTSYFYNTTTNKQNDVLITIGPAPTGENTKRRQLEYDALGRLKSVCELTTTTGSATCGQSVGQTGFYTTYTYDVLGDLTSVTQNAQAAAGSRQTRSYSYDGLGRLTSETNPESGTTSYVYDTIPSTPAGCANAGAPSKGDMTRRTDAAGNYVCPQYDALHRVTDVGSNVGGCKRFRYDNSNGVTGTKPVGVTVSNGLGRLAEAETDNCSAWPPTPITDEWFSYSNRGETTDTWQSSPHSGGYYHNVVSYWANGAPNVLSQNGGSTYYIAWNLDGEGRVTSTTPGSGVNPLSSTTYNAASLPMQLNFGSGDSDTFTYDPTSNRMTQYKFTIGTTPQSVIGNLTWNANGSLKQLVITDPFDAANAQTCNYTHDDLSRIASANCGTAASQTFTYDAFGNLNKVGSPFGFQPSYSSTTNHMTSISGFTPTYDAAGNVTNDSLHTYTWDAYTNPSVIDSLPITYDAFDRMVEQNRSGTFFQFSYSPTGFKMQKLSGQSVQIDWVPLPGGATAVYGSTLYIRHSDWLGSSRFASTLGTRAMYSDTAYAPFGEPYAQAGTTDLSFTGMNQDTSGNLYDFPARPYGIQGRWPSPDPAGLAAANLAFPQSWNRYAYVANSPLNLVDPLGLCPAWGPFAVNGRVICTSARTGNSGPNGGDATDFFGGSCGVDGAAASCGLAYQLVQNGTGAVCPDNNCSGLYLSSSGTLGRYVSPGEVTVTVGGAQAGQSSQPGYWELLGNYNFYIDNTTADGNPTYSQQLGALTQAQKLAQGPMNVLTAVGAAEIAPVLAVQGAAAYPVVASTAYGAYETVTVAGEVYIGWRAIYQFSSGFISTTRPFTTTPGLWGWLAGRAFRGDWPF